MSDFLLSQVVGIARTLTPARTHHLLRQILGWKDNVRQDDKIRPGESLVLWVADLLAVDEPVSHDQIDYILGEFSVNINDIGRRLWKLLEEFEATGKTAELISGHLTLYDHRYARLTGSSEVLDLQKAEHILAIPQAPLKVVAYDLTTLFTSSRAKMVKKMKTPVPV